MSGRCSGSPAGGSTSGSVTSSTSGSCSPRARATSPASVRTPVTRTPGTRAASSALPCGTTTAVAPARTAATTDGSTPRTGRTRPSRPSSPSSAVPSNAVAGTTSCAVSIDAAMGRSNELPRLGSDAGDRLTVTRLVAGQS